MAVTEPELIQEMFVQVGSGATRPCTLFIDPLGRPLSPFSVAGMNRRDRRKDRRR